MFNLTWFDAKIRLLSSLNHSLYNSDRDISHRRDMIKYDKEGEAILCTIGITRLVCFRENNDLIVATESML